jgi:hypothetical protein
MDFFTVPTLTFGMLYCFFVMGHDRRKILRFNLIRNPSALWIVRQMREAWPWHQHHGSRCSTATLGTECPENWRKNRSSNCSVSD